MKKGWKLFWIICGSLAAAGAILLTIGILLGGLSEESREAGYTWLRDHTRWKSITTTNQQAAEDIVSRQGTHGHHAESEHRLTYAGIRSIEIECGALEVQVASYDGDEVMIDKSQLHSDLNHVIVCRQDEEELEIEAVKSWRKIVGDPGVLRVLLPKEMSLDEFSGSVGAGILRVTDVDARDINIEVGAGEVSCTLPGLYEDYNYDISCGMGEVTVGSRQYGGVAQDVEIDNGRDRSIDISCGMGEVTIDFREE